MYSFWQEALDVELFKHAWYILWTAALYCWAISLQLMYYQGMKTLQNIWTECHRGASHTREVSCAKNGPWLAHGRALLSPWQQDRTRAVTREGCVVSNAEQSLSTGSCALQRQYHSPVTMPAKSWQTGHWFLYSKANFTHSPLGSVSRTAHQPPCGAQRQGVRDHKALGSGARG